MASFYDLKNKINSTKNTGQVTKALQIVAASKQKKTQDNLKNSRFLRDGLKELIANISNQIVNSKAITLTELPLFFRTNVNSNKVLIINVMSQRGLCGSLNTKLFYKILKLKKEIENEGKTVDFISVNRLAQKFLKSFKENIIAFFGEIKETPDLDEVMPIIDLVKDKFNEYNKVYLAYSKFVKTGFYEPELIQLLPIDLNTVNENHTLNSNFVNGSGAQYIIEPDPFTVLENLSNLYIDLEIYEAVLSNIASENTARMISMKKATDNIKTIVDNLTLKLNKERQAKITQQVAEISANL